MLRSLWIAATLLLSHSIAHSQWSDTGSLHVGREAHPALLLPSGQVLVVGGIVANGYTATAELYNPATGTWSETASMTHERFFHTATLMQDSRVLVVGGEDQNGNFLRSTEYYNPATGSWTPGPELNLGRSSHSATLLRDGSVLVAGGNGKCVNGNGLVCDYRSAEILEPASGKWSFTGNMNIRRQEAIALLLPTGKVLIASGNNVNQQYGIAQSEIYDPSTGAFTLSGKMTSARAGFSANLLLNGQVLAAGGCGNQLSNCNASELYNPATGLWTATGHLNISRDYHVSSRLPSGKVLVAGGNGTVCGLLCDTLKSAEIYDPATGVWTLTASMNAKRAIFSATLLRSGSILVEGGAPSEIFGAPPLATSELFTLPPF
jgi:hypothetical protein